MIERKSIDVAQLLLDTSNFRTGVQESQKSAREAIIQEQGRKLQVLALDVIKHGFSPADLPIVYPLKKGSDQFVMLEGNRRLLVVKLILDPELSKGSIVFKAFSELHKKFAKKFSTEIYCVVSDTRKSGLIWVERKHSNALDGAGTDQWNPIAKYRFDAELGKPTPNLDALDFVHKYGDITADTSEKIRSAKFPISTLDRLLGDDVVKKKLGLQLENGKLLAQYEHGWTLHVLTSIVEAIASGRFDDQQFSVRSIDKADQREEFSNKLVAKFPKPVKSGRHWNVDRDTTAPKSAAEKKPEAKSRNTSSTADRKQLIPRGFKLSLPDGKINDVYVELRKLDVAQYSNAVSVLLRVFLGFGLDRYIQVFAVSIKKDASVLASMQAVIQHMSATNLMTEKELKGINRELGDVNSLISPQTWNAYVHNPTFGAKPNDLKLTWNTLELFVTKLWSPASV
jgi:hypothetical protein